MKTVLLTGKSGFIGQNVYPVLKKRFNVLTPTRFELDLRDIESVTRFFNSHDIDIVYHCANPNYTRNSGDKAENMAVDSIRLFLNLYAFREKYDKMIYLGSGAEYNKALEISNVAECECFRSPPDDDYGFAKYTINRIADKSENIYNLCVFGCYGAGDDETKFITHCIRCVLRNKPITIRQDCKFDYIHVSDLARIMVWAGENALKHRMYNISGCNHAYLSEIADMVRLTMRSNVPIKILSSGLNREYTCNGERLWLESRLEPLMSLKDGIALQIKWEKEHFK